MELLEFREWRQALALAGAFIMSCLERLIGNPWRPEDHGQGIALVCLLVVLDWLLGTYVAMRRGRWCYAGVKRGVHKMAMWAILLTVSHQLQRPLGINWSDSVTHFAGDYLLVYLIWVDLLSVLRHVVGICRLAGVRAPGLAKVVDRIDRWHSLAFDSVEPPSLCPQPQACARANGKSKGGGAS